MPKKATTAPSAKKAATKAASKKDTKPSAATAKTNLPPMDLRPVVADNAATHPIPSDPVVPTLGLSARMAYPGQVAKARELAEAYYKGTPLVPDHEYDSLLQEIRKTEASIPGIVSPLSPTQQVMSSTPVPGSTKVKHATPMLSLDNAFNTNDLRVFCERVGKLPPELFNGGMYIEPKVDGIAIDLLYEDGALVQATTRGDGVEGEDVTAQVYTISNLPRKLEGEHKGPMHVRGEVYIPSADFSKINEARVNDGDDPFANPRNAAAGAINSKDLEEVRARRLAVVCYDVPDREEWFLSSVRMLSCMRDWGLPTLIEYIIHMFTNRVESLQESLNLLNERRSSFPFAIDGAVIKLANLKGRLELGNGSNAPRWASAFKYPPEEVETTVTSVTIQVGRRGTLTPVAEVVPVHVSGSTVSRASLSNWDKIARLDVRVGDHVMLCKGGEIIPDVVRVLTEKRTGAERPVPIPAVCPFCGSRVGKASEDAVAYVCTGGTSCPEIQLRILEHACSKDALDIRGVGPSVIEKISNDLQGVTLVQLLSVTEEDLTNEGSFTKLQAAKILDAIQVAIKRGDQARLLYSLSIPDVGDSASRALIANFGGIRACMSADEAEILSCPDLLPIPAKSFVIWRENPEAFDLLAQLEALGFVTTTKERVMLSEKLKDQTWVITGTLSKTREHFEELVRLNGGKVGSDVSKKTAGLLAGEKAGGKLAKAQKHNVKVYNEAEFTALLEA